ncbi:MAG: cyclic 2,3-diphosphoglycerate synthase [Nitrososphaerota archaeon]|jgi:predicted GTPase|uniref:cyclic 2,3-diphosphoglycerate synthase n=1 Tax=Candidatus Bathycorpusculum sp. TaxID=2994959 RepID=UPI00282D6555|nr:cyclic 2,3-diphosphoglycerate synthase [Candidatus Termiticorpusculum sp.]MCL2256639.1 cyclic 2,3-diphosphoglycerate synthase [Candidatus Termiticorpusculum sp.]MCL2293182.1 cyclic 2,3-diphosphoglycerate synthase [Candidatus Termiticorpusculum sp.]MDR0461214.1 cyclic 2,3-diphosphoglycerate synthase [Nitrososphaerota archaeon]
MAQRKVIIIGAAGRDFHNFNTFFRNNSAYKVVAFTATQIPDIANRKYPAELAGSLYPEGIPIYAQDDLRRLIKEFDVDECVFAYSDVPYSVVMSLGAQVNAAGADFSLLGHKNTMLKSTKPVIAVGAVRTGCGKSQTSRRVAEVLMAHGLKVIAVRHPMPYGDLVAQKVQRFATIEDLKKHHCTIEEMEEYEPHIARGNVIYAGVDYEAILRAIENDPKGCDIILWDGGNNDFPFYKPDLMITVVDPLRPGHELAYYPGETTLRIADVVVINKIDSADFDSILTVRNNIERVNPKATVIDAASTIKVDNTEVIKGKKVLVIEDGPTLTHGEMKMGAGIVAARRFGAAEIIDPRPYAVGRLAETYQIYPNIGKLLPAMGYGEQQMKDLAATIEKTPCDSVIIATPIDLGRVIQINKPNTRVQYNLQEIGQPNMENVLEQFIKKIKKQ